MDYTKKLDLMSIYTDPWDYNPPKELANLQESSNFPNLNSIEYRLHGAVYQVDDILHPFLEVVEQNEFGQVLIAGNDYRNRRCCGSFSLWNASEGDSFDCTKSRFRKQCKFFIHSLKFINNTNFVVGNSRGSIELYSIGTNTTNNEYCLFHVGIERAFPEPVTKIDVFAKDQTKCITGSKNGCLKIWDISENMYAITTIPYAHAGRINGISTNKTKTDLFATCSNDKSAFIWDLRDKKEGSILFMDHEYTLSDICWSEKDGGQSLIWLADINGTLHHVDIRKPNEFVKSVQVFGDAIHRMRYSEGKCAVVGNNQIVKVFNDKLELLYEDKKAPDYLRDVLWHGKDTFYTIGWDTFSKKHTFQ